MINYVDFADLANIMGQNYDLFEVHIVSLEWAKQIFTTLEKSRNVIMHSGELGERDIERIGMRITKREELVPHRFFPFIFSTLFTS